MGIRVVKNEDRSPIAAEVLDASKRMGEAITNGLWLEAGKQINDLIIKHNGLDQVLVISYFSQIITMTFAHGLEILKDCADQAHDNEMTKRSLFEDLIEGLRFFLNLPIETNKHEFKKLK